MTRSDRDHLRILSVCHYVLGGLCLFIGCFPMLHLVIGVAMVSGLLPMNNGPAGPPPEFFGWFFIAVASFVIALYWSIGLMLIHAGDCLRRYKSRTFCLVAAGVACLMQPLGIVLGVFTFIVLLRPSVSAAFERTEEQSPGESPGKPLKAIPHAKPVDPDEHDRYQTD